MHKHAKIAPSSTIQVPPECLERIDAVCVEFEQWLAVNSGLAGEQIAAAIQAHVVEVLGQVAEEFRERVYLRLLQELLPLAWAAGERQESSFDLAPFLAVDQHDFRPDQWSKTAEDNREFIKRLYAFWSGRGQDQVDDGGSGVERTEEFPKAGALPLDELQALGVWIERYRHFREQHPNLQATEWLLQQQEMPQVLRQTLGNMDLLDQMQRTEGGWSIGDFEIVREIGRGGMGVVFEAIQRSLGRTVALKVLWLGSRDGNEAIKRFQREALTVAKLHHTNIVPIFFVGSEGPFNYYAMQFIEGASLDQLAANREHPLDWETVADWGLQAAEALEHAHQRGIIHRDVKPSNLLIDSEYRLWLTDFGLAKQRDDVTLSVAGALLGTPRYMSPEQASASLQAVDQRSDVYSLGATLYELVTGKPVFDGQTPHGVISQILTTEPVPANCHQQQLPRDFNTVLMKCLAKEPNARYQSAAELANELRAVLDGRPIRAKRPNLVERSRRWLHQHRKEFSWSMVSLAVCCAVLATTTVAWLGYRQLREAHLTLNSPTAPMWVNLREAHSQAVIARETIPTQDPLTLPPGDYQLQAMLPGLLSQHYQLSVAAGEQVKQSLNPTDQLLAPPKKNVLGTHVLSNEETSWIVSYDDREISMEPGSLPKTNRYSITWDMLANKSTAASFQWQAALETNQNLVQGIKSSLRPHLQLISGTRLGRQGEHLLLATRHQALVALIDCRGDVAWSRGLAEDVVEQEQIAEQHRAVKQSPRSTTIEGPFLIDDLDEDACDDLIVHIASIPATGFPRTSAAKREVVALSGKSGQVLWRCTIPNQYFSLPAQDVPYHYKWFTGLNSGSSEGGSGTFFNQGFWIRGSEYHCELSGEFVSVGSLIAPTRSPSPQHVAANYLYQVEDKLLRIASRTGELADSVDELTGVPLMPPVVWHSVDSPQATLYWIDEGSRRVGNANPTTLNPGNQLRVMAWSLTSRQVTWQKVMAAHLPFNRSWDMAPPRWPQLTDLDGDQQPEIIFPDETSRGSPTIQTATAVSVIDATDGRLRWRKRVRHADTQLERWIVGPDRDGDGIRDVYLFSMAGMPVRVHLDVLSGADGTVLLQGHSALTQRESATDFFLCEPIVWDHSPDGWPQIVVPLLSSRSRGKDGTELMVFSTKTGACQHQTTQVHAAEVGDVDGDMIPDLALTQFLTPELGLRGQSETNFIRGSAGNLWDRLGQPLQAVADLNQDGTDDLVAVDYRSITARDALTGEPLWQYSTSGRASRMAVHSQRATGGVTSSETRTVAPLSPSATGESLWDFDRDGTPDLIVESQSGGSSMALLEVLSGRNGKRLWSAQETKTHQQGFGALRCIDLEQDGKAEIVYLAYTDTLMQQRHDRKSWSGNDGHLVLHVLEADTGQTRWRVPLTREFGGASGQLLPYPFQSNSLPDMAIGDLNGDGVADIVAPAEPNREGGVELTCTWRAFDGVSGETLWSRSGIPTKSLAQAFTEAAPVRLAESTRGTSVAVSQVYFLEVLDRSDVEGDSERELQVIAVDAANGIELWKKTFSVAPNFRRNVSSHSLDRLHGQVIRNADNEHRLVVAFETLDQDRLVLLDAQGSVLAERAFSLSSSYPKPPIIWSAFDSNGDGFANRALIGESLEVVDLNDELKTVGSLAVNLQNWSQVSLEFVPSSSTHLAQFVVHERAENPRVVAFDASTGNRLWSSHGPTRHPSFSSQIEPTLCIVPRKNNVPIVVYNYLDQASARLAFPAPIQFGSSIALNASGPQVPDVRFRRSLPWMEASLLTESPLKALMFLLVNSLISLIIVLLPLGYAWLTIKRSDLSLRWFLLLPAVVALMLLAMRWNSNEQDGGWIGSLMIALAFAPAIALVITILRRCWQRRWLAAGGLCAAIAISSVGFTVLILATRQLNDPLQPGEYYSWDGWYWSIPQALLAFAVIYWSLRMLSFSFRRLRQMLSWAVRKPQPSSLA